MNSWGNIYQTVQQAQQMQNNANFMPVNNMPIMFNQMNSNVNNPMDQILFMSMLFNQNMPQMNMGGNQNFNMGWNQNFNMGGNQNFNMGGNQNFNMGRNNNIEDTINICFSTLKGARINMRFKGTETVDSILTKFLKRVNLENMINNLGGKLNFILSAETLKFGDQRKLKDLVYMPGNFTTVLVHDSQNLIGAH
jgi:hypothetical protein